MGKLFFYLVYLTKIFFFVCMLGEFLSLILFPQCYYLIVVINFNSRTKINSNMNQQMGTICFIYAFLLCLIPWPRNQSQLDSIFCNFASQILIFGRTQNFPFWKNAIIQVEKKNCFCDCNIVTPYVNLLCRVKIRPI